MEALWLGALDWYHTDISSIKNLLNIKNEFSESLNKIIMTSAGIQHTTSRTLEQEQLLIPHVMVMSEHACIKQQYSLVVHCIMTIKSILFYSIAFRMNY